jgi:hypothetical protein
MSALPYHPDHQVQFQPLNFSDFWPKTEDDPAFHNITTKLAQTEVPCFMSHLPPSAGKDLIEVIIKSKCYYNAGYDSYEENGDGNPFYTYTQHTKLLDLPLDFRNPKEFTEAEEKVLLELEEFLKPIPLSVCAYPSKIIFHHRSPVFYVEIATWFSKTRYFSYKNRRMNKKRAIRK